MAQEAFLKQLKVYPLQLEAYLLQFCSTECFTQGGGGLPPASAGDTLPPAAWLVPEGASPPGFLCFFNLNVVCFISLRHGII